MRMRVVAFIVTLATPFRTFAQAAQSLTAALESQIETYWVAPKEASPGMKCSLVIQRTANGRLGDATARDCATPALAESLIFAAHLAAPLSLGAPPFDSDVVITFSVPEQIPDASAASAPAPATIMLNLRNLGASEGARIEAHSWVVNVCIQPDGKTTNVQLLKGSGDTTLDEKVLQRLRELHKQVKPPPAGMPPCARLVIRSGATRPAR